MIAIQSHLSASVYIVNEHVVYEYDTTNIRAINAVGKLFMKFSKIVLLVPFVLCSIMVLLYKMFEFNKLNSISNVLKRWSLNVVYIVSDLLSKLIVDSWTEWK